VILVEKAILYKYKTRFSLSSLTLMLVLGLNSPHGQDFSSSPGTAEFQYIGNLIYARPAGIAGAYTSLAQGLDAIGSNPAGLSKSEPIRSISGTFRYHFLDVSSGNATYGFPGDGGRSYAFSAAYMNFGRIQELDEFGEPTSREHMPVSFNPAFTVAVKAREGVRLGATVKAFSEYLGDFEESQLGLGWGVDGGLLYQPSARNLGFGLALLNLGRKVRSQLEGGATGGLLPVSLKGGMYYYPLDIPKGKLAVDIEIPWHDVPLLSGGIEYAYSQALTLRAGSRLDWNEAKYVFKKASAEKHAELLGGNALKLATGFTFQAEGLAVDYAVQYWLNLSWVHAITLRYALI
jgi:hypothetical protein